MEFDFDVGRLFGGEGHCTDAFCCGLPSSHPEVTSHHHHHHSNNNHNPKSKRRGSASTSRPSSSSSSSELRVFCWSRNALALRQRRDPVSFSSQFSKVVDSLGEASALAQGLPTIITTVSKILVNDHTLFLMGHGTRAIALLKIGKKKLFIRSDNGRFNEIEPTCVLDFYVHESLQRKGVGKILFEAMLDHTNLPPNRFGYDRPSAKLLPFLARHYNLKSYVPQTNSFVVFNQYFTNPKATRQDYKTEPKVSSNKENKAEEISAENSPLHFPQLKMDNPRPNTVTLVNGNVNLNSNNPKEKERNITQSSQGSRSLSHTHAQYSSANHLYAQRNIALNCHNANLMNSNNNNNNNNSNVYNNNNNNNNNNSNNTLILSNNNFIANTFGNSNSGGFGRPSRFDHRLIKNIYHNKPRPY